jgi:hypothetical protein
LINLKKYINKEDNRIIHPIHNTGSNKPIVKSGNVTCWSFGICTMRIRNKRIFMKTKNKAANPTKLFKMYFFSEK